MPRGWIPRRRRPRGRRGPLRLPARGTGTGTCRGSGCSPAASGRCPGRWPRSGGRISGTARSGRRLRLGCAPWRPRRRPCSARGGSVPARPAWPRPGPATRPTRGWAPPAPAPSHRGVPRRRPRPRRPAHRWRRSSPRWRSAAPCRPSDRGRRGRWPGASRPREGRARRGWRPAAAPSAAPRRSRSSRRGRRSAEGGRRCPVRRCAAAPGCRAWPPAGCPRSAPRRARDHAMWPARRPRRASRPPERR